MWIKVKRGLRLISSNLRAVFITGVKFLEAIRIIATRTTKLAKLAGEEETIIRMFPTAITVVSTAVTKTINKF